MRTSNRIVLVVAAAVAIAGPALAGDQGSTPSSTPPGFSNSGGHNGFETFTHTTTTTTNGVASTTTTTEKLPGGWDEG